MQYTLPKVKSEILPIVLKGHERSLTKVKYNADGDLIFSCAKDNCVNVWYESDGLRLGTFNQHKGTVWDIDPSWDSQYLLTACADAQARLFEATTGKFIARMPHEGPVRVVSWSEGTQFFATANDFFRSSDFAKISIFDFPPESVLNESILPGASPELAAPAHIPKHEINVDSLDKATCLGWTTGNRELIASFDKTGIMIKYDVEYGKEIVRSKELIRRKDIHTKRINNFSFNSDKTLLITASSDMTSCLVDPTTLDVIKTYQTSAPVNGCAISPTHPHVLIGGGQDAMSVTTTSAGAGKFECRFFHMIYNEEFGRIAGHFGPINTLAVHPFGKSYASGGEDGFIRLHHFDAGYLTTPTYYPDGIDNILTSKD